LLALGLRPYFVALAFERDPGPTLDASYLPARRAAAVDPAKTLKVQ
jgi:ABC-type lipoprotein release transport system permease subunit